MKITTKELKPLYFEDVKVGMEVPSFEQWITPTGEGMNNAGIGQFCESHITSEWAMLSWHTPIAFGRGLHLTLYLGRVMTDWIGPNGVLKKLGSQHRSRTPMGDKLTFGGKVTKKYVKNEENLVECDLWAKNTEGDVKDVGWATVALPSRK